MANAPINDLVLVQDLSTNEFDVSTGKVKVKIDPSSPVSLVSESAAGMVLDLSATAVAAMNAATTVSNAVTGSGATQAIVTTVNGKSSASVLIPDTQGVTPISTVFDGTTGLLTTTLSDGTKLTANIGVTPVDQFLDTVAYVASTATLKLTMSNGSVKSVPLSDLVKVTTGLGISGDGTTAAPVILKVDPASTSGVVSTSSIGLKITIPPVLATLSLSPVAGAIGSETRSIQMTVNGAVLSIPLAAQRAGLSQAIISWAFPAN